MAVAAPPSAAAHDVIVVVLSPDPERVLGCLGALRTLTKARLVVVGPAGDSRLVLRSLRAGAADFADEDDLEADLPSALGRLEVDTGSGEPGRTIAILSPNGGSGSSTIAVNVATVLAKEHQSTLLLDLKLTSGDLASLLDLKPTHTLAELCQNAERMDRIMFERSLVQHSSGIRLLAPPRSFADIGYVTAEGIGQALHLARSLFPYVVVDLDHSFREEQLQVLRQADVILLVIRLDFVSLAQRPADVGIHGAAGRQPRACAGRGQPLRPAQGNPRRQGRGGARAQNRPLHPRRRQDHQPVEQQRGAGRARKSVGQGLQERHPFVSEHQRAA